MKKNNLGQSRWLMIETEFEKKAGKLTGTYAVAYIADDELEELFYLLDKTARQFIAKKRSDAMT